MVIILCVCGAGSLGAHILLARARGYFLWLGAAFFVQAFSLLIDRHARWVATIIVTVSLAMAAYEAYHETKERLRRRREDERQRLAAFSTATTAHFRAKAAWRPPSDPEA
jgi:membrane protein implicated in regulation of membrane protease activity